MVLVAMLTESSILATGFWAKYTADMAHRHVLLAYGFAWAIQLAYLAFVVVKARGKSQGGAQ